MSTSPCAYLRVRVVPRASRTALSRDPSGVLRAHLTAAPVGGAANRALVALLAERLRLPRRSIELARGTRGRDKLVCVRGASAADLAARLGGIGGSAVDKPQGRG
jgi:uncharacterized protein YggU (UPF0235/DUF167 family)